MKLSHGFTRSTSPIITLVAMSAEPLYASREPKAAHLLYFITTENVFVETKRKLVDECDLWAIISLPGGVFSIAGAEVKTNLLFSPRGASPRRFGTPDLPM